MKKTNTFIEEEKQFEQKSEQIFNQANSNFNNIKLEESEQMQGILASDVASVTFSDKRAYFCGNYFGSKSYSDIEAVELDTIRDVQIKTKKRKKKLGLISKLLPVTAIILLCITYILSCITDSKIDKLYNEYYLHRSGLLVETNPEFDSLYDALKYALEDEDAYAEEQKRREKEFEENTADILISLRKEEKVLKTYVICMISFALCFIAFCIINIIKSIDKFLVMQFICPHKTIGIEILNDNAYEKINEIISKAKQTQRINQQHYTQQVNPIPQMQQSYTQHTYQQPGLSQSKLDNLKDVSKLYEQGMISEQEFNKLKNEILNS